jgi:putative two-component system response regulator
MNLPRTQTSASLASLASTPTDEILIADDDSGIRDMLARVFAKDFKVLSAEDGSRAMLFLEQTRPAAIIVDEQMPGATGTQVLQRAKVLFPDTPRILMTAMDDTHRAATAINDGEIHRFYSKPLKVMEVRRAVVELVEKARERETLLAEIGALRQLREQMGVARAPVTRVLIVGDAREASDRVEAASQARGFSTERARRADELSAALMTNPPDVVALALEPGLDVRSLALLIQTIDETVAIVIVDRESDLSRAMLALEIGAVDYVAPPFADAAQLAARLERAASRPRAQRDLRRLTFELIVANRELTLARKRVEAEQVKLLNAMIRALEARDSYTAGHTDRVAAISVRAGQALGMQPTALETIRMGALLHDIGKIGVRDDVLLKPGRLSNEEFEVIKTHTTIGASLLSGIEQFTCILPIVRNHHEKLDGTGYPDKLGGDRVILEVRVVSASDVLDALTSTRPYRRGSAPEEAFEIIDATIGKHLDGNVVGALKQVHQEGRLVELLQRDAASAPGPGPYRE